jgi:hypothetical protein
MLCVIFSTDLLRRNAHIRLSISTAFRQANPLRARTLPLLTTRTCFYEKLRRNWRSQTARSAVSFFNPPAARCLNAKVHQPAVLRSIRTQELQEWSPTQEDVDAYVDSLEHELSEESVLIRQRAKGKSGGQRHAPKPKRLSRASDGRVKSFTSRRSETEE